MCTLRGPHADFRSSPDNAPVKEKKRLIAFHGHKVKKTQHQLKSLRQKKKAWADKKLKLCFSALADIDGRMQVVFAHAVGPHLDTGQ